jgi:hypothetical protein
MVELQLGDIIRLKKQHPCGSNEWQVVRLGADIRIECTGCHRLILLERGILEKRIRAVLSGGGGDKNSGQGKSPV